MEVDPLLLVAVLVIALALVVFFAYKSSKPSIKRDAVLLVGPSFSGKTTLFSQLCHGYPPQHDTVTSIKESIGRAQGVTAGDGSKFEVVDVPGLRRLRNTLVEQWAPRGKALLFMVDSVTFDSQAKDVAEYLYDMLSAPSLVNRPALVVCNKQDMSFRAATPEKIRQKIETEFSLIRKTRSADLDSTSDGDGERATVLGKPGETFKFEHLGAKVEFIDCIAKAKTKGASAELGAIEAWLSTVMSA